MYFSYTIMKRSTWHRKFFRLVSPFHIDQKSAMLKFVPTHNAKSEWAHEGHLLARTDTNDPSVWASVLSWTVTCICVRDVYCLPPLVQTWPLIYIWLTIFRCRQSAKPLALEKFCQPFCWIFWSQLPWKFRHHVVSNRWSNLYGRCSHRRYFSHPL